MSVRSSALYSILNQGLTRILALISVMIIARMLTPDELGIYAISASIAFIASEFRSLGTASYLIREKDVDDPVKRNCLGIGLIISWGIGLTLVVTAPFIKDIYQLNDLDQLIWLLSFSFFIAPFTVIPYSMMSKKMSFGTICFIAISAQLMNLIVTVLFLNNGSSYFSLAYGLISSELWRTLMYFILDKKEFFVIPSFKNMSKVFNTGIYVSLGNFFKRFTLMSSDLVLGRIGTTTDVALYSRAVGFGDFIASLTTMGISAVALPYISNEKHQKGDISKAYTRATNIMLSIVWPALAVAIVLRDELIHIFFGSQWTFSAEIFPGIAIWIMLSAPWALSNTLYIVSKGEKFRAYKEGCILLLTFLTIWVVYPSYGLINTAYAMIMVGIIDFIINLTALKKISGLQPMLFCKNLLGNIALTIIAISFVFFVKYLLPEVNILLLIILIALLSFPVWLISMNLLKLELYNELQSQLSGFLKKNKTRKDIA